MNLPALVLAKLPDLDTLTGVFGSLKRPGHDDTIIVLATIVWETGHPPGGGLF